MRGGNVRRVQPAEQALPVRVELLHDHGDGLAAVRRGQRGDLVIARGARSAAIRAGLAVLGLQREVVVRGVDRRAVAPHSLGADLVDQRLRAGAGLLRRNHQVGVDDRLEVGRGGERAGDQAVQDLDQVEGRGVAGVGVPAIDLLLDGVGERTTLLRLAGVAVVGRLAALGENACALGAGGVVRAAALVALAAALAAAAAAARGQRKRNHGDTRDYCLTSVDSHW